MTIRPATTLLAIACLLGTVACQSEREEAAVETAATVETSIGSAVNDAMATARRELAAENISLSPEGPGADAEITPKGDLLIDGRAVAVTPEQRQLLLEYRSHVVGLATAGMEIGTQGADLAAKAVGEALRGVFSGQPQEIERRIEAQADGIRQAALKLCGQLPGMLDTQRRLVAAMPEFAPYATMDASDIDECRSDASATPPAPPAAPAPPVPPTPPAPTA